MSPEDIKRLREAYPLTQGELARRSGVSASAVRSWEAGRRTPRPPQVRALRAALAVAAPVVAGCGGRIGGCACTCHGRTVTPWSAEEERTLRAGIERNDALTVVAEDLTRTFGHPRSAEAVKTRAERLGISRAPHWHSEEEVRRLLGVSTRRVRRWRRSGALRATRDWRAAGMRSQWWRVEPADLSTFVARYAGIEFDPASVRDRALREQAEIAAAVNRRHGMTTTVTETAQGG